MILDDLISKCLHRSADPVRSPGRDGLCATRTLTSQNDQQEPIGWNRRSNGRRANHSSEPPSPPT
jgi:hypothetical protein